MKSIKHRVPAAVLPTVIVISTLMLIGIMGLIMMFDNENSLFRRLQRIRQHRSHLESFFTVYENDPEIFSKITADGKIRLFQEDPYSELSVAQYRWGLYEIVMASVSDSDISSIRIYGSLPEYPYDAALWLVDYGQTVTVAGTTRIVGDVFAPARGLTSGRIGGRFFEGDISGAEVGSAPVFPKPEGFMDDFIHSLGAVKYGSANMGSDSISHSFDSPEFLLLGSLEGIRSLWGKIVIKSPEIRVDKLTRINDCILVAEKVFVEDDVSGSFQIFATDSVVIGKGCRLELPSGVLGRGYIEVGEDSHINGYVVSLTGQESNRWNIDLKTAPGTAVRGLLYCYGVGQIQGLSHGGACLDRVCYSLSDGIYQHTLLDAHFLGGGIIPHPVMFEDQRLRTVIKILE